MSPPRVRPGAQPFAFASGPIGVLMVHGFTGSPASMRPIGEWLAERGLSVEGVRLPGHGTDPEDLGGRRWTEWVEEAERGLEALRSRCRTVVAFGQSMGASVVLQVAAARPHDLDGLALASPYVFDPRHWAIPIGRRLLRTIRGIGNDIAAAGRDELAYDRIPVPAIAEAAAMMRLVRRELPNIRHPVIVFAPGADHVVPRSNPRKLLARIGSERTHLVACPRSYHVITLDHDAPLVRERLLAFARGLDAGKA